MLTSLKLESFSYDSPVLFKCWPIAHFAYMKTVGLNRINNLIEQRNGDDGYLPVDLVFRTFNESAKSGGRLVEYKGCEFLPISQKKLLKQKDPLHAYNRTRNVKLQTGDIKKVHLDFITSINNIQITL